MTEDYCSFEVAKLLKERGFNEPLRLVIRHNGVIENIGLDEINANLLWTDKCCSCVSHQMAMKWLREIHKIYIEILSLRTTAERRIYKGHILDDNTLMSYYTDEFESYEGAVEEALKYCLTNLIANG